MALSSFLPALSSPPPNTAALLNRSGCPSSTSSSPSCSVRLTPMALSSPRPYTAAMLNRSGSPSCSVRITFSAFVFMPFLRPTTTLSPSSRRNLQIARMAPEEEKMTRRSPLDFPIEWERPKPGRRPDIFPQFSPMKTPLPPPMPGDPPEEDEEEEEEKEKKEEEEEGEGEEEREKEEDPTEEDPERPEVQ